VDPESRVSAGEGATALGLAASEERSTAVEGAPADGFAASGARRAAAADVVGGDPDLATRAVFMAGVFGPPAGSGIDRTREAGASLDGAGRSVVLESRGALATITGALAAINEGAGDGSASSGRRAGSGRARRARASRPTGASISRGSITGSDGSTTARRGAGT
jgi:hypothetical protein